MAERGRIPVCVVLAAWFAAIVALCFPYLDIDSVQRWGLDAVLWLQDGGEALEIVSRAFSYLGDDIAYIAALPILIFSISYTLGIQVFILFCTSTIFNVVLKSLLHGPRPSWLSSGTGLVCDIEYGNPSGHSQTSFALYLFVARHVAIRCTSSWTKCLSWSAAVLIASGISCSRSVVGAHFPHQVLGGALLGAATFATYSLLLEGTSVTTMVQDSVSGSVAGTIAAMMLSLVLGGLQLAAWAVTAATFDFPDSWAKNGAAACPPDESIDDFGAVRLTFLFVGLLASLAFSHGVGILHRAMLEEDGKGGMTCHRITRGVFAVVVVALVYFGIGAAVSKQWHVVLVLMLRYYFRGLFTGVAHYVLVPVILQRLRWLPTGPPYDVAQGLQ